MNLSYFLYSLTLIFVVAQLGGWIAWSWWWVLAPSILAIGILVFALFTVLMAAFAIAAWG